MHLCSLLLCAQRAQRPKKRLNGQIEKELYLYFVKKSFCCCYFFPSFLLTLSLGRLLIFMAAMHSNVPWHSHSLRDMQLEERKRSAHRVEPGRWYITYWEKQINNTKWNIVFSLWRCVPVPYRVVCALRAIIRWTRKMSIEIKRSFSVFSWFLYSSKRYVDDKAENETNSLPDWCMVATATKRAATWSTGFSEVPVIHHKEILFAHFRKKIDSDTKIVVLTHMRVRCIVASPPWIPSWLHAITFSSVAVEMHTVGDLSACFCRSVGVRRWCPWAKECQLNIHRAPSTAQNSHCGRAFILIHKMHAMEWW